MCRACLMFLRRHLSNRAQFPFPKVVLRARPILLALSCSNVLPFSRSLSRHEFLYFMRNMASNNIRRIWSGSSELILHVMLVLWQVYKHEDHVHWPLPCSRLHATTNFHIHTRCQTFMKKLPASMSTVSSHRDVIYLNQVSSCGTRR